MDYFRILNLEREPFSNSPDPDFFYTSPGYTACLQNLELGIRLKRGLNVVIGDVGTGKTTLCRFLIRKFAADDRIETHLILDPGFDRPADGLLAAADMFGCAPAGVEQGEHQLKEAIKNHLFGKGVDEGKTTVLIIDEGQKMPAFFMESVRELLNFETNAEKLLQVVIFAQKEFDGMIRDRANFADRINSRHDLAPLRFKDMRRMILFRLEKSAAGAAPDIFTLPAMWAVHLATGGYPRKAITLCHKCLLAMIIKNKTKVRWGVVRTCARTGAPARPLKRYALYAAALLALGVGFLPAALHQTPTAPAPLVAEGVQKERPAMKPEAPETGTARQSAPDVEGAPVEQKAPGLLGRYTMKPGDTIGDLVHMIYGAYRPDLVDLVMAANPQVKTPTRIRAGASIAFPAAPAAPAAPAEGAFWIELNRTDSLSDGINAVKEARKSVDAVRLMSYWTPREGLAFSTVIDDVFKDETSAAAHARMTGESAGLQDAVVRSAPPDAVFFSDPFKAR